MGGLKKLHNFQKYNKLIYKDYKLHELNTRDYVHRIHDTGVPRSLSYTIALDISFAYNTYPPFHRRNRFQAFCVTNDSINIYACDTAISILMLLNYADITVVQILPIFKRNNCKIRIVSRTLDGIIEL